MAKSLSVNESGEYHYRAEPLVKILNLILALFSLAAISSLVLQYGFYLTDSASAILNRVDLLIVQFYLWQFILKFLFSRSKLSFLKRHWFETVLAVLILSEFALIIRLEGINVIRKYFLDINITAVTEIYVGFAQILIILSIIIEGIHYNTRLASLKFHPAQTMMLSYIVVILIGTALLMLPKATPSNVSISFIDALFTATSAACVTGFTVIDTAGGFTMTGKLIILFLVQIGGLGIMTFSSFLAIFFGQGVGIRERVMLHQMMNIDKIGMISTVLRNAVILTLSIEAAGAILLMFFWADQGWTTSHLIFNSVFHSISAFCNAGISTFSDNLSSYHHDIGVLITISSLVILGGLGFIVILELIGGTIQKKKTRRSRLSIQSRMVLIISGLLLLTGFVLLYMLDGHENGWNRAMTAFFNSVTARSCGFNTVDFATLNNSSILIIMVLMFIGASPGSTGGGIKTTTLGILWASIGAIITGQNRIVIFKRRIPFLVLNRALVVFAFSVMFVVLAAFLLSITETAPIIDIIFESVSAFSTVGLSRGLTQLLTTNGKLIIILVMFIGRLGALTLAFAITAPTELPSVKVEYPSESVMIG